MNNGTFWNRNLLHESFGYDNFYYHTKDYVIDETIGLGLSDKSFFNQSIPKIKTINATCKYVCKKEFKEVFKSLKTIMHKT